VGGVILGEEIPVTCSTRSISLREWWTRDQQYLSLEEVLALVLGLQLVLGVHSHGLAPRAVVLAAQVVVRTSERGDRKESDQNESQELHCRSRKSVSRGELNGYEEGRKGKRGIKDVRLLFRCPQHKLIYDGRSAGIATATKQANNRFRSRDQMFVPGLLMLSPGGLAYIPPCPG